jgi:hypothetical protein
MEEREIAEARIDAFGTADLNLMQVYMSET